MVWWWRLDSDARAAIIGAVVGGIFALLGSLIPYWASVQRDKKKERELIQSWRVGLSAELGHILVLIDEAKREIEAFRGYGGRLISDFLEATRFKWCEFDSDRHFLMALAKVYRNIVLTNKWLDCAKELRRMPLRFMGE